LKITNLLGILRVVVLLRGETALSPDFGAGSGLELKRETTGPFPSLDNSVHFHEENRAMGDARDTAKKKKADEKKSAKPAKAAAKAPAPAPAAKPTAKSTKK
jgi:hypothetical protein